MPSLKKFKVVQVLSSNGMGGLELAPLLLAGGLRKKGWDVSIWCDPGTFLGERAGREGFSTQSFQFRGYWDPRWIFEIRAALKKDPPDVLHLHQSRDLWVVVPALAWAGWTGPLLLTKHVESRIVKKDAFHGMLYRRVDRMLTCSDFIRENVIWSCPISPEKVVTSHMPVDRGIFRPDVRRRKSVRRRWGWDGNFVVGMTSRLSPRKGHELFLETAARLSKMDRSLRFRVAGTFAEDEAWFNQKLLRLRRRLGIEDLFVYDGYVPDLPGFHSGLDLFVHLSDRESFGMAVVEAMSCGKAVAVRKGGGVGEILEGPKGRAMGGLLLEGDDPAMWAEKIAGLVGNRALLAKFQKESLKMAQRFDLGRWVDRHLQWYRELLERP